MPTDELIPTSQVAARLGVTVKTVTRWAATGKLEPVHKIPGRTGAYLFSTADVDRLEAMNPPEGDAA